MGKIVDLRQWREHHADGYADGHPAGRDLDDGGEVARLEAAIGRLSPLVSRALDLDHRLEPRIETELLAIMGELTVGLVAAATGRAERLADRLAGSRRSGRG